MMRDLDHLDADFPIDDIFEFGEPAKALAHRPPSRSHVSAPPPAPKGGLNFFVTAFSFCFLCAAGFGAGSLAQLLLSSTEAQAVEIVQVERDFTF